MRINIKDIKKGQVFWEKWKEFVATSDPIQVESTFGEQWTIQGRDKKGQLIDFTETEGYSHYGPKLSTENEYPFVSEEDPASMSADRFIHLWNESLEGETPPAVEFSTRKNKFEDSPFVVTEGMHTKLEDRNKLLEKFKNQLID
jgi:hypothetical protein